MNNTPPKAPWTPLDEFLYDKSQMAAMGMVACVIAIELGRKPTIDEISSALWAMLRDEGLVQSENFGQSDPVKDNQVAADRNGTRRILARVSAWATKKLAEAEATAP